MIVENDKVLAVNDSEMILAESGEYDAMIP